MRPSFPVEGGCPCGAVRYRLLEDPLELHVCHCMDFQRASGSAFVMTMSAPRQALEVVQGRLATVSYETVEGFPRCDERGAVCYARLWSQNTRYPEIVAIRPGTFDDTSWLEPIAHLWTIRAQPFVVIPKGVLRFDRNPADDLDLVRAWKGTASLS